MARFRAIDDNGDDEAFRTPDRPRLRSTRAWAPIEIGGVTADSRASKRGDLFVAVAGHQGRWHDLRRAGARRRAPRRLSANDAPQAPLPNGAAFVQVANARKCACRSRRRASIRSQPKVIAAVTGTSGKTSVAAFTRQIWTAAGL